MLSKLQKKTLVPAQIIGYAVTLLIGTIIILTITQLYSDFKPLLQQQSDVFEGNSVIISKNVSVFKTMNKEKIYFKSNELEEIKSQPFIKSVSSFHTANFKINAHSNKSGDIPIFYTDLFFESIPDRYLDVSEDSWQWNANEDFIPIVIPENYLNLYNFGFAESQGLPVLSKSTISQVQFNIQISGNGKSKDFRSRIVGFSSKINSILVPEDFLSWANRTYGANEQSKTSRLLLEFKDPSDERILQYFNEHNYAVNKEKLEFSKLVFFFKSAFVFVFLIATIIIILSIAFILLSINLIIQKNKEQMMNLYNIGYSHKEIAKFYQKTISIITVAVIILAMIVSFFIRKAYINKFNNFFDFKTNGNIILMIGVAILIILVVLYNGLLTRNIKKVVTL